MKRRNNRLLGFILLNIIISAATTLIVLSLWERAHPRPVVPTPAVITPAQSSGAQVTATATLELQPGLVTLVAPEQADMTIESVFAPGNQGEEYVQVKNNSTGGSVALAGWRLDDEAGSFYTFPVLTLNPGSAIRVRTASGIDSVTDLFWGRAEALWQVGKTVRLLDPQGNLRASFQIR